MTWQNKLTGVSTSALLLSAFVVGVPAKAFTANWQQGASIQSRYQGDFGSADFRASMDRLIESGVNHVSLVAPHFQNGPNASDIFAGVNTPDDDALISGIRYLKSQGVEVSIKLFMESGQGWRAEIRPSDKGRWFDQYTAIAVKYGQIAQAEGVAMIVLGTEMVGVASAAQDPANTQYWRDLIASVRGVYSGALTYGGNWGGAYNEKAEIEFWDDLDYIGVSAYYEPGRYVDGNNVEALKGYWAGIDQNELAPLSAQFGKPIIFTEVGYRNISGTTVDPWNFSRGGEPNEGEQLAAYQALFEYFSGSDYLAGIHLWDWSSDPGACGSGNFDYTYCGKLAEDIVRQYYSGTGGLEPTVLEEVPVVEETPEELPVEPVNEEQVITEDEGVIEVPTTEEVETDEPAVIIQEGETADESEETEEVTEEVVETVEEVIEEETETELPLDDSNFTLNPEVISEIIDDAAPTTDTVATDDTDDTEIIPVTVFPDEDTEGDEVVEVTVEVNDDGTLTTTSVGGVSSQDLDIWWVTDGQTVHGLQPFKAMMEGMDLSDYDMYWQVDGDQLNPMGDSTEEYPHKQALVDLTNWNWDENGEYEIAFVVMDKSGEMIAEQKVMINVVNF